MLLAGSVGLGLVWGWLAVLACRGARWQKIARVLLSIVVQALVVGWLATPAALVGFAVALVVSAAVCAAWLRALELRFGVRR